jgi:hypothetical protein
MRRFSVGLVGLCVWGAACADSGGLPAANGSAVTASDGGSDTGPMDSGDASADASGPELRAKARSYAHDQIPCTSDSDCCVAIDYCKAEALVVGVADQAVVQEMLNTAYQWTSGLQDSLDRIDFCSACAASDVRVACGTSGWCVGEFNVSALGRPHCGGQHVDAAGAAAALNVTPATPGKHALTIFSCDGELRDW